MSIEFSVIQRGEPGVVGGGVKKYYATNQSTGELTLAGLSKRIEQMCTVNGADVRAVVYALLEVMILEMADGKIVRLGELGSLRVTISSEGVEKEEDVRASTIRGAKVIFTPGKDLKTMLETLTYEKIAK